MDSCEREPCGKVARGAARSQRTAMVHGTRAVPDVGRGLALPSGKRAEELDFDGDGDIDAADFELILKTAGVP